MKNVLRKVTDFTATKKGMWITLSLWFVMTMLLALFAPGAKEYEVSSIDSLPQDAQSVIAQMKVDQNFEGTEDVPALLVFQSNAGELKADELSALLNEIRGASIVGLKEVLSIDGLPPQAVASFFSDDKTTAVIPVRFDSGLESKQLDEKLTQIKDIADQSSSLAMYVTGPAGIAVDSLNLFSRADVVLLLSTVGLILILLIVIYRSPLLALIPLLAAAFVYEVVNQLLGLFGKAGLELSKQSLSIMSILLFAAIIDYSLFVFSRFREELKQHENKFDAMKWAMRETGLPVFFSGGTVLVAMLLLFFAEYGDYRNFAPIFGTTMFVIMLASVTLVPALFTLFGRKSFWPKIPRVGDQQISPNSVWSKVGRMVTKKPIISALSILILLVLSASNLFNLSYEFDTIKSFPNDMPSRVGYEILEDKFEKGDLAPTTVLFESERALSQAEQESLRDTLSAQPLVNNVRLSELSPNEKVVRYSLTFTESPYAIESMDALENMREESGALVQASGLEGTLYFAGETATKVDDRAVNNRDLLVMVLLESILIFLLLIAMTRSVKMPIYMIGTILLSFLSAVGLGLFLTDLLFDIEAVSNRVPLYTFVFLVALGIDYNIILISRFMEERRKHPVKKAVELAVASTGGVISSAGFLLAATFAVLMTQPIQVLFVFGFIVAIGILLDTFLIRGILLPALIVMFEKDKPAR
ncbi:MMPL domain-containing protein [Tumebacillus algifaecis]|uniref:MMPL domain-containing protein n=1 Tax=Tumebacillus algifaecis TaxID=1214604 RepID=A0A223D5C8_9BACL|nr:MMPL family transporter [Tumebacillus algifaecis]ASS76745.1 MMPL domain-containing protein [Tumebacillus algifaecis]